MMKNTLYPLTILLVVTIFACQPSNPDLENAEAVPDRAAQQIVTGGTPSEDLKANAIPESDYYKQVKWSLGAVQEEMKKSIGKVNGLGEITILLDQNYQMALINKHDGKTYEKRVNLANLDNDVKNVEIISDAHGHPNPGFKMKVLEGKPGVEYYINGSKQETLRELEIIVAERKSVHKILSAMINAVNSAKGIVPETDG